MEASVTPLRGLTYQVLSEFHLPNAKHQAQARTAMNGFLKHLGKTYDSLIGEEMGVAYDETANDYLNTLSQSTREGYRSRLKTWQESYQQLRLTDGLPESFSEALAACFQRTGLTLAEVGRACDVHPGNIGTWLSGKKVPRRGSLAVIARIEREFELPVGTLTQRLSIEAHSARRAYSSEEDQYRYELCQLPYSWKMEDWTPQVLGEWQDLFKYKTAAIVFDDKGNLLGSDERGKSWNVDSAGACPTAAIVSRMFVSFFGWLLLPTEGDDPRQVGKGMLPEQITFALISDAMLVYDYLEFQKVRSRQWNSGTKVFLQYLLMLLHPKTGYLPRRSHLGQRLPEPVGKDEWVSRCANAHKNLRKFWSQVNSTAKPSRKTEAPLREVLNMEHPIDALLEMCDAALEEFNSKWATRKHITKAAAIFYRDILLNAMLTSNPLRCKNWCRMTWTPQNTGHLRQRRDGAWWFCIPKEEFKNQKHARSDRDYEMPVNERLWPLIETYLKDYRPKLVSGGNLLFPSSQGGVLGGGKSNSLYLLVRRFTARWCPYAPEGFGTHGYRHIIATDYIKNHPEGFEVAAAILHDKPETVRAAYAHLVPADRFRYYDDYLNQRREIVRGKQEADVTKILASLGLTPDQFTAVSSLFKTHGRNV